MSRWLQPGSLLIKVMKIQRPDGKMQETNRRGKYKDTKYYKWNVTTDETTRPSPVKQINSKQLNTFYKFNINERYKKYEMTCQEIQQTLKKVVKIQPKLKYFNGFLKREYQIEKKIDCNKLNEDYNRHKF